MITEKDVMEAFERALDLLKEYENQNRYDSNAPIRVKAGVRKFLNESRALHAAGRTCPTCRGTGSV